MTKPSQKRKRFTRNSFTEHNYSYVNRPQITQSSCSNRQNHLFSQRSNVPQQSSISVNFHDYSQISQDKSENYPFFQQNRNKQQTPNYAAIFLSSDDDDYYQPDIFAPYKQEYRVQQNRPNLAS